MHTYRCNGNGMHLIFKIFFLFNYFEAILYFARLNWKLYIWDTLKEATILQLLRNCVVFLSMKHYVLRHGGEEKYIELA